MVQRICDADRSDVVRRIVVDGFQPEVNGIYEMSGWHEAHPSYLRAGAELGEASD